MIDNKMKRHPKSTNTDTNKYRRYLDILFPLDIVILISSYLDLKSILRFGKITKYYYDLWLTSLKSILQYSLKNMTKLSTNDYKILELINLYKIISNKNLISAGKDYSLLKLKKKVFGFGCNTLGQIGVGSLSTSYSRFKSNQHLINTHITQISAGTDTSLILTEDGMIYSFGNGSHYQLGYDINIMERPYLIPRLNNIIQVSSGYWYSLVLRENDEGIGEVYGFGYNRSGELGLGDYIDRKDPVCLNIKDDIIQVSTGGYHSLVLSKIGSVYSFGTNSEGQLGLNNWQSINIPTMIPNISNIVQLTTGYYHSMVLNTDGKVYSFGHNGYGQLGLGIDNNVINPTCINQLKNIVQISAGRSYSLALNNRGQVYGFGDNDKGQLGLGDLYNRTVPICIVSLTSIISISAGFDHSLVLQDHNKVYGFGSNSHSQLQVYKHKEDQISPDQSSGFTLPTLII